MSLVLNQSRQMFQIIDFQSTATLIVTQKLDNFNPVKGGSMHTEYSLTDQTIASPIVPINAIFPRNTPLHCMLSQASPRLNAYLTICPYQLSYCAASRVGGNLATT